MSVATKFENFCDNILISDQKVSDIKYRYERITKQLNKDFYNIDSDKKNTWYVGSYGGDTDIHVSDIDILFQIPLSVYEKYNNYSGNGQSALLQQVKKSIENTYKTTDAHGDGQVVAVDFTDDINFEIVPGVLLKDNKWFWYPDTNNGGSWKTTNPFAEINAIRKNNIEWNYNLKKLCRMIRVWKDYCNVPIWWLLIDALCNNFMKDWSNKDKSYLFYDWMIRDFFEFLKNQDTEQKYWLAPWSNQYVWRKGNFEYKAKLAYNISLEAIEYEKEGKEYSANQKWKEIFGSKFIW